MRSPRTIFMTIRSSGLELPCYGLSRLARLGCAIRSQDTSSPCPFAARECSRAFSVSPTGENRMSGGPMLGRLTSEITLSDEREKPLQVRRESLGLARFVIEPNDLLARERVEITVAEE